jgi:hypothetical protein
MFKALAWVLWAIKLVYARDFLLNCLYQARKMSGHFFVFGVSILPLSAIFIF